MSSKASPKMCMVIVLAFLISMSGNAKADFIFGEPMNLEPPVNSQVTDIAGSISADGLSLYVSDGPWTLAPGGYGGGDLWVHTRATNEESWGEAVNLGSTVNTSSADATPSISADGLLLFFHSNRPGGFGGNDIYMSRRETTDSDWGTPENLGPKVNSAFNEVGPNISADGLTIYFTSDRSGGLGNEDIWLARRVSKDDAWDPAVNPGAAINSSTGERRPYISADDLLLFFHSRRSGGYGIYDIWVASRATPDEPWEEPVNLGPTVNGPYIDVGPIISADGQTLYFTSDRPGGNGDWDIWQIPVFPVVDLNNDGIVDSADMCILVDNWGTDEPLCDIGPMPWGDGIVDVQDLIVLAEHLFEEVPPVE